MNTQLLYGLVLFTCDLRLVTRGAAISPIREDALSLRLRNPFVHDVREPFEYGAKRDTDSPEEPDSKERRSNMGSSFIRFGRNHPRDATAGQVFGYGSGSGSGSGVAYAGESAFDARPPRGRSDNIIRFGRSSPKVSHHRGERGHGFERILKSESSKYARLGGNVPVLPSKAEMAILCPNLLVEESARGNKDLQMYLAKLVYVCNNNIGNNGKDNKDHDDDDEGDNDDDDDNNNDNNDMDNNNVADNDNERNVANGENTHRGNLDFLRVNGDTAQDIARGFTI